MCALYKLVHLEYKKYYSNFQNGLTFLELLKGAGLVPNATSKVICNVRNFLVR